MFRSAAAFAFAGILVEGSTWSERVFSKPNETKRDAKSSTTLASIPTQTPSVKAVPGRTDNAHKRSWGSLVAPQNVVETRPEQVSVSPNPRESPVDSTGLSKDDKLKDDTASMTPAVSGSSGAGEPLSRKHKKMSKKAKSASPTSTDASAVPEPMERKESPAVPTVLDAQTESETARADSESTISLFVEFSHDRIPTIIIVDGCPLASTKERMHVVFREQVLFEFGTAFAVVHRATCLTSFLNEVLVPIIENRNVVGSVLVRVSESVDPVHVDCKSIDWTKKPLWIGHRGSGANCFGAMLRENTIESFNNAMTHAGIAGIELDVSLTADGELAVFHDLTYPASVNGKSSKLPVASLTYREHMRMTETPTLEQVLLSLVPRNAGIVIELKYPTNDAIRKWPDLGKYSRSQFVARVLQCLTNNAERIRDRWIVLSSFDPDITWILSRALQGSAALVVHNVWFGHEADVDQECLGHFSDTRNAHAKAALEQARLLGTGLAFEADYALSPGFGPEFAGTSIRMFSYGRANLDHEALVSQERIDAFFIDDMNIPSSF